MDTPILQNPPLPNHQDEWPEPGDGFDIKDNINPPLPRPSDDGIVHLDNLPLIAQQFI